MKRLMLALTLVAAFAADASAVGRRTVVINRGFRPHNAVVVRNFGGFGFHQPVRNFGVFVAPSPVFFQPTFVNPGFVQPFGFQQFGTFNTFGGCGY